MKRKPSQIKIGRYVMFRAAIEVWLDLSSADGECRGVWTETGFGKMVIGAKGKIWPQVYRQLLHESMEWAALLAGCHYCPSGALSPVAGDAYLLVMTHPQFTRVCDEAGDFLAHAAPELEKIWKKHRRET